MTTPSVYDVLDVLLATVAACYSILILWVALKIQRGYGPEKVGEDGLTYRSCTTQFEDNSVAHLVFNMMGYESRVEKWVDYLNGDHIRWFSLPYTLACIIKVGIVFAIVQGSGHYVFFWSYLVCVAIADITYVHIARYWYTVYCEFGLDEDQ